MTAQRIGLVAWHVFKESVRDRVLYGIGAFALLMVAASILLGQITAGQDVKIIKDLGLAVIELAGVLMTVFIGVGLVAREIERKSIHGLLAKPLPRWEFVIGKYAGLVLTVFVNVAMMTAAFYVILAWLGWTSPANVRSAWEAPAADPRLLLSVVLIGAELALLTAVALFFSTFSSSALVSIVLTIGVLIAGWASQDLRGFTAMVESPMGWIVDAVGWVIPAFSEFDVKAQVVHAQPVAGAYILWRLLYAVVYSSVTIGAAILVFTRREFK